jgi:purine-nucleoside phosphorylase
MVELDRIKEAVAYLQGQYSFNPEVGVVLGSGLGNFSSEMNVEKTISYSDIPHFPEATVEGHSGKLFLGEMSGKKIVAMAGRFHYYRDIQRQRYLFLSA